MIRSLYPTDLIMLPFLKGSFCNVAKRRYTPGEGKVSPINVLIGQWLVPKERRHTWVATDGASLQGLVSARSHSHATICDVDYLLLRDRDEDTCHALLCCLGAAECELGMRKIFLRLPNDNSLMDAAEHAGFHPYLVEHLYWCESEKPEEFPTSSNSPFLIRPQQSSDEYRLFELYSRAVPAPVRTVEAMTFQEWHEVKDGVMRQRKQREFICEKDGDIAAWLGIASAAGVGQLEIVSHPTLGNADLEWVVRYGLGHLHDYHGVYCSVPEFQGGLRGALLNLGFQEMAEHSVLARQSTVAVREPSLIPAHA